MDATTRALLTFVRAWPPADRLRALLDRHDGAEAALASGPAAWADAGFAEPTLAALRRPDEARLRADRQWLGGGPRHVLGWHHPDYPALLRAIPDPPPVLFVEGDPACLWHPHVAIVGSRKASHGGRDTARAFARGFVSAGFGVASGLAAGIDTAAHLGALDGDGKTVAVVATGLDIVFPPSNRALAGRIAAAGAIVSEYPPGHPGLAMQFPARNRLIAGLALGTLVVEAAERSGALITARLAAEAGREVFALPGSIHNPMARGCHRLIRQGVALVETVDEVVSALGPVARALGTALRHRLAEGRMNPPAAPSASAGNDGDREANSVMQAIGFEAVNLDQLARRTGLTVANLASMLLSMELDGRVIAENGRYVRRT
jgi:DNA processing protein